MSTRNLKIMILALCFCLLAGFALFLYNAYDSYNINSRFTSLPLKYDADDSSSSYHWRGVDITIYGGFVKGIQGGTDKGDSLVLRALSPLPVIELKSADNSVQTISICLENINPQFYASGIDQSFQPERVTVNTLAFTVTLEPGEQKNIKPDQSAAQNDNYVILGDSRDGYKTFSQIIEQVNAIQPVFVIDNGDLVFSGKPNQYRLFDKMASSISTTLCTTLGNHDIRRNGRETYTKLYGPAYYSFDYANSHFIFLDSSPGWSEKQAISEEQYAWLQRDLQKAQGKLIYVITHIPPVDPRSGTQPNEVAAYIDKIKQEGNFFEQKLDKYSETENMDHGFQDKQEAVRFEELMSKFKVDTVYLSHIHSYYNTVKNGVRYIISGGAGAELLTENSYYHYLTAKMDNRDFIVMVELTSPANMLIQRYAATVILFVQAIYKENTAAVIMLLTGLTLLVLLVLLRFYIKRKHRFELLWILLKDSYRYFREKYKELFKNKR